MESYSFARSPHLASIHRSRLKRLNDFKAQMRSAGLLGEYGSPDDLQHEVRKAIEYDLTKLDLGRVTVRSGTSAQARKVVTSVLPVAILGEGMWRVSLANNSGAPITGIEVGVRATVSGEEVGVVPAKSRIDLGNVAGSLIGEVVGGAFGSGAFGPALGPLAGMGGSAISPMAKPRLQGQLNDYLADGFETALAAQGGTVVVYASDPQAGLSVTVAFDDENGVRWTRVDNSEPIQVRE